jgi:uncharacterized protein Yka (UPF0111/DUF47 family)
MSSSLRRRLRAAFGNGRDGKVLDHFLGISRESVAAIASIRKTGLLRIDRRAIRAMEKRADVHVDQIHTILDNTFILALDKTDIGQLADYLDEMIDRLHQLAEHTRLYSEEVSDHQIIRQLRQTVERSVLAVNAMVRHFAKKNRRKAYENLKSLKRLERTADNLMRAYMEECIEGVRAGTVTFLQFEAQKGVVQRLESTTDAALSAARVILSMIHKGA